ncbi:tripartite tricarboxylate transporter TctB family protein [Pseudoalteromonas sp. OANN1]|uniref:tripartite tricarboxylate transporter TctB family protein n=1 Tax=Pseudoalteromonas sp. OANN1 TaxID=2954497 RepID=UPI0020978F66|nr:tripartite tricarboxylate transporter TctB family protein [Pseudoalteromonas sp. OANN1]MCO7201559.1 tripartite tricarboxylate transporter TctB family protein [Pseudoalteromonas sp. OANN1]
MLNRELLGPVLFLILFSLYAVSAWQIPIMPFEEYEAVNSATLPKVYALIGIVVCLLSIAATLFKGVSAPDTREGAETISKATIAQCAALIVLMLIYSSVLEELGFIVSTILFLGCGFLIMGERRKQILLLASVPVVIVFWAIMTQLLGIYLVPGDFWS